MRSKPENQKQHSKASAEKAETSTAEQVSADESLRRMKAFIERKEKFIAAVKKS
ncbi:MAG: hypothetical protein ABI791_15310 [Acidobacteriota bacterium]